MRFSIFYEHQVPRPWPEDRNLELERYHNALEQIELADKLGYHCAWEVEHHFLEEYSHSSAPEVFLAAASQRTKNIRLGHGIMLMPPPVNHPARAAERIAALDLVSRGRVEFGTGESSTEMELGGFNVAREEKRAMWEEGLTVALRCMVEEPFRGHEGRFVSMPPRNVVPKPMQKPHPPVWVACSRRDTIGLAAQRGIGALAFAFISPAEAQLWVEDYYRHLENDCVPIGYSVNANIAILSNFMCLESEEEAVARGLQGAMFLGYSLGHYFVFGEHVPGRTDVWDNFVNDEGDLVQSQQKVYEQAGVRTEYAGGYSGNALGAIGTPEQLRAHFRELEEVGVDEVILASQLGNNRHEDVLASLSLFAEKVMPEFAERDEALRAKKAARLEPVIEAAMARRRQPEVDAELAVVRAAPKGIVF